MPRQKKVEIVEEQPNAPGQDAATILVVLALVIAAAVAAMNILATGDLYVKVEWSGDMRSTPTPLVCVYEGDVSGILESGDVPSYPQALVAATVQPGSEVKMDGRWKGTYTVALVTTSGRLADDSPVIVTTVGKDETHVAFELPPVQENWT